MELKQSITGELNTHSVKCDLSLPCNTFSVFTMYDVKNANTAIQNGLEKS